MKTFLFFVTLLMLTAFAQETLAQTIVDTTSQNMSAVNEPPNGNMEATAVSSKRVSFPMSPTAFQLSLCVLGFGVLLIIGEIVLVYRLNISPQDTIKFILVSVIVIGSLYLITAGYTNDQIAPAMGLLGTIAGYLLGKMGPESAAKDKIES
ncbi:hypothetical protein [Flavobacterium sp.]|uniref:hypothetical protein n=1 Tax=Flavobacterium sp. TaxID=239 RepID=UPI00261A7B62|nr:hypothetical protein [Flavobacterium sp.]